MPTDESINMLLLEALEKIEQAIRETHELRSDDNKYHEIAKLGRSIALIREFQQEIYERHPELKPNPPADYTPDPEMTKEQIEATNLLSSDQVNEIDEALLSQASNHWQKVAKIVGMTMTSLPFRINGIPDLYYAQRVKKLVTKGLLESQGNLQFMRFSEVRLPIQRND